MFVKNNAIDYKKEPVNILHGLKNLFKDKGFLICFFYSIIVLIIFFGKLLVSPNTTYFGISGDALQTYYNSIYHVFFDKGFLNQDSMHYPYNESVFFTGCMPLVTSVIKIFGLKHFTLGIINLIMLFSLPLSAISIYLIFKEYKVNYLFASLSAVAIAFLTPQLVRMGGHYNLAYCFAIPVAILFMVKFFKKPNFKKSIIIAFFAFFIASTHMYLFVFVVAIISFSWLSFLLKNKFKTGVPIFLKHYIVQVITPFLILELLIFIVNDAGHRTTFPWGFFEFYSNPNGVFYPFNRFYEFIFKYVGFTGVVNYEGIAFIGICADILVLFLISQIFWRIITLKFNKIGCFTNDVLINCLILCAIICLLFSFCIPFAFGYKDLVYKLGFIKQFRALGRFTWIFFYVMNIALIYIISIINEKYNKYYLKNMLMIIIVGFLSYDSYCNVSGFQQSLNNKISSLNDKENIRMENAWIKTINLQDFQAILPFPYFHFGSENLGINTIETSLKNACIVSLKTGLPMISVFNSRVSLEQSYKNIQLLKEPTGIVPQILNDFKNNKDILIVSNDNECNYYEKKIINLSSFIDKTDHFSLYKISLISLKKYYKNFAQEVINDSEKAKLFSHGNKFKSTDSTMNFLNLDFSTLNNDSGYIEKGTMRKIAKNYFVILDSLLPNPKSDSAYVISFWIKNLKRDLLSRSNIEINAKNNNGETYNLLYSALNGHYIQINNEWTLIEHTFKLNNPSDRIRITIWNESLVHDEELEIDNLLFRSASTSVFLSTTSYLLKNNRIYYRQ